MRDLLTLRQPGSSSWALNDALAEVAAADAGVLVLLDTGSDAMDYKDRLDVFLGRRRTPRTNESDGAGNYLTTGTGAQILRDLGVGRMRLLSSPWKFSALSGFGLEVVELVGSDDTAGETGADAAGA